MLSADPAVHGFIHRTDVADLVLAALADPANEGRFLMTAYASQALSVHPIDPFPPRVRA